MKKSTISLLSLLFIGVGLFFTSCDDEDPQTDVVGTLSVSEESYIFEPSGNPAKEFTVEKSAESFTAFRLNEADSWVKINLNDNSFTVTVDDFTDQTATENRETIIAVTSGTAAPVRVFISQKYPGGGVGPGPGPGPTTDPVDMILEDSRLEFEALNDLFKSVKLNTEIEKWDIEVVYDASWITKAEVRGGSLRVTVEQNLEQERETTITLKSDLAKEDAVLTVYQDGHPEFDLSGIWKLTGKAGPYNMGKLAIYLDLNETVEIVYDEESETYLLPLEVETTMGGKIRTHFVFRHDAEKGAIIFEQGVQQNATGDKLSLYVYNYILMGESESVILPVGYEMELSVNSSYTTVQAPSTLEYEDKSYKAYLGLALNFSQTALGWGLDYGGYFIENFKLQR